MEETLKCHTTLLSIDRYDLDKTYVTSDLFHSPEVEFGVADPTEPNPVFEQYCEVYRCISLLKC